MNTTEKRIAFDFGNANVAQREAIKTTDGPLLIIAGPGTGKTSTLVNRILYLVIEKNIQPQEIMVVTFTDKAALELVTRLTDKLPDININEMYIGTFHSVFLKILGDYLEYTNINKNFRLLDSFDQVYLLYKNITKFEKAKNFKELDWTEKRNGKLQEMNKWKKAVQIDKYISTVKEELIIVENLKKANDSKSNAIGELYDIYQNIFEKNNVVGYSDILLESYNLLINNENILHELQNKISYIMVDEYQDTNYIQEQLVLLLSESKRNLCVVGDDDQSLYRFRGATVSNIINFPKRFNSDECKTVFLNTNYRSSKPIIDFYNEWMSDDGNAGEFFTWGDDRFDKKIEASSNHTTNAPCVVKCSSTDEEEWYNQIVTFIKKLKEDGIITDYNQVVFLTRNVKTKNKNKYDEMIKYIENNGIPVYAPRFGMFFERDEVMQFIGTLICCFPAYKDSLLSGEMKYMVTGAKEYYKKCIDAAEECMKNDSQLAKWVNEKEQNHKVINKNLNYNYSQLIYQMLAFDPFYSYVNIKLGEGLLHERASRNIALLIQSISKYENSINLTSFTNKNIIKVTEELFNKYLSYLKTDGINEYEDNSEYAPSNCLSFMTIHQSKGMEFPVVMVSSLDQTPYSFPDKVGDVLEGYYRRKISENKDNIDKYDFWRLYYTAFSRAQNLLVLTCHEKSSFPEAPSNVFEKIHNNLPSYNEIDLSKIPTTEVKPVRIKETYSFTSHVGLYDRCPLQYKYFKEIGFKPIKNKATFFGSLVHETIEDIHRAVIIDNNKQISEERISAWLSTNYGTLSLAEHTYLSKEQLDAVYNHVFRYVQRNKNRWSTIQEAEAEVSISEPNYILLGKVDLIRGNGKEVELVDFKSEKKTELEKDNNRLQKYYKQLQIYAHIMQEKRGIRISKAHLYCTGDDSDNPQITFDITNESTKEIVKEFEATIQKIQAKDFTKKTDNLDTCKNCEMKSVCDRERKSQSQKVYCNKMSSRNFYHTNRDCKYLSYAKDKDILVFNSIDEAKKAGYACLCMKCKK